MVLNNKFINLSLFSSWYSIKCSCNCTQPVRKFPKNSFCQTYYNTFVAPVPELNLLHG